MSEPALPDKVIAIDHALADADLPHAFGGALALAYYAEPRATIDIDVNVFVAVDESTAVGDALTPLGVRVGGDEAVLQRDGQTRWWWGRTPIDVFFSYGSVHDAMQAASRIEPFGADQIPILGPEHLVVCKVVFDRAKDWIDIPQVLATVDGFDVAEVHRWLGVLLAPDDHRRQRFDELAVQLLGP